MPVCQDLLDKYVLSAQGSFSTALVHSQRTTTFSNLLSASECVLENIQAIVAETTLRLLPVDVEMNKRFVDGFGTRVKTFKIQLK